MADLRLWKPLAALALVVALALLWARGNDWKRQADLWRTATAKWEQANKDATRWALAEKAAREAADRQRKDQADAQLETALVDGRDAARRYADANRCVRVEASGGRGVGADLPGAGAAAQVADRAGPAPELLVGISDADLAICAANTLRLENARGWALSINTGSAPATSAPARD